MPRKPRQYHIVVELIDSKWTMQFGDYDKEVATQEMQDQKENQRFDAKSRKEWHKFKVVTVASATQTMINVTLCEMNGETYTAPISVDPIAARKECEAFNEAQAIAGNELRKAGMTQAEAWNAYVIYQKLRAEYVKRASAIWPEND